MQHLDLQVIEKSLSWMRDNRTVWLCTVLSTFGSSPREPGAWLATCGDGQHIGSLSGGCVEENFLERLKKGEFNQPMTILRYGDSSLGQETQVTLPCGGTLDVLVECLSPTAFNLAHFEIVRDTLLGNSRLMRSVDLSTGDRHFINDPGLGPRVIQDIERERIQIRIAPVNRLIIAGISAVSVVCAELARSLGFEVIVCDPREEACHDFPVSGVEIQNILPSLLISSGVCHMATAVVALTHDPRIDDLAMIEAVRTPAFYIGVMGSIRTSEIRGKRLRRSGGLSTSDVDRIHMPIGLALGSKTPAEIALAVMADIIRVLRGKSRYDL